MSLLGRVRFGWLPRGIFREYSCGGHALEGAGSSFQAGQSMNFWISLAGKAIGPISGFKVGAHLVTVRHLVTTCLEEFE